MIPIGRALEPSARRVLTGLLLPVIKVSHGSLDTHARQRAQHDRLLAQLADALAALSEALRAHGRDLLVMTCSESGRRPAENASGGTDHGTAAPHLLLAGAVQGGLHGQQPDPGDPGDGDLHHHVDGRSLHATVARRWWGLDHRALPALDQPLLDVLPA